MINKLTFGALVFGCLSSFHAFASTEEQESIKACENYVKVAKNHDNSEYFIPCTPQNRSPSEWKCMQSKRFKDSWSYMDASKSCFKDAPALHAMEKTIKNINNLKASEICNLAVDRFEAHGDDAGMPKSALCPANERTALMWACMAEYAQDGNSFMYSAGQCFPRLRPYV